MCGCPLGGAIPHGRQSGSSGREHRVQLALKLLQRRGREGLTGLRCDPAVPNREDQRGISLSWGTPNCKTKVKSPQGDGNSHGREARGGWWS